MALLGKFDDSYTKTGNSGLTRFANKVSLIPVIGGALSFPLGMLDTAIDTGKWLLRGKFLSALTVATAGTISNAVNVLPTGLPGKMGGSLTWWMAGAGSGLGTGKSLGTHARKVTEMAIGGLTGALGVKPQVLKSYQAGIGSVGAAVPAAPGRFATQVANERGQNSQQMYNNYMRGEGGVHVNELSSAHGRGV